MEMEWVRGVCFGNLSANDMPGAYIFFNLLILHVKICLLSVKIDVELSGTMRQNISICRVFIDKKRSQLGEIIAVAL